ncbi:hypothetical protein OB955_15905 [Halobacteria archaeon AArc-m2/3/4]|uniref:Uncharacterized protein n=1 Tax=Natronoglomus mannanivorans TaxID=2979990 RepID=A0AAP3E2L9_9EURY|nr:hypothetical protein [Halobacteria archaeon AArc-xg1-1]MCU4974212.1 hypothetical protein [Halobacteria archaeon AArc-m2/3/4]
MTDTEPPADAARMFLGQDALSQRDDGFVIDCPECGSSTLLADVVREGRCSGYDDVTGCGADLWLELAWDS